MRHGPVIVVDVRRILIKFSVGRPAIQHWSTWESQVIGNLGCSVYGIIKGNAEAMNEDEGLLVLRLCDQCRQFLIEFISRLDRTFSYGEVFFWILAEFEPPDGRPFNPGGVVPWIARYAYIAGPQRERPG